MILTRSDDALVIAPEQREAGGGFFLEVGRPGEGIQFTDNFAAKERK